MIMVNMAKENKIVIYRLRISNLGVHEVVNHTKILIKEGEPLMESKLTAIELTGTVNEDHQLQLDKRPSHISPKTCAGKMSCIRRMMNGMKINGCMRPASVQLLTF
jgi:hypothetical protein